MRVSVIGALRWLSGVAVAGGAVLIVGATPGFDIVSWPSALVGPGATLVASGLGSSVALRGIKSFEDRRREQSDDATLQARSRIYEEVIAHVTSAFLGGSPLELEAAVRAKAATWASPTTLRSLADWFRFAGGLPGVPLTVELKIQAYEIVYRLISNAREDLYPGGETTMKDDLLRMVFNDYSSAEHNPSEAAAIVVGDSGTTNWESIRPRIAAPWDPSALPTPASSPPTGAANIAASVEGPSSTGEQYPPST